MTKPRGFTCYETIRVGLPNLYECAQCFRLVDCMHAPEPPICPICRGESEAPFEKVQPCPFDHLAPATRMLVLKHRRAMAKDPHSSECAEIEAQLKLDEHLGPDPKLEPHERHLLTPFLKKS
jgi:hypothetical protein